MRFRENAESIAFYRGEAQEAEKVRARLGGAVENKRALLATQRNLELFTVGYAYLIQILPVLAVAPLYFAGTVQLGVITQARHPTPKPFNTRTRTRTLARTRTRTRTRT